MLLPFSGKFNHSTLKMEAVGSLAVSVLMFQTTLSHTSKKSIIFIVNRPEN